jgi:hypothetical protein
MTWSRLLLALCLFCIACGRDTIVVNLTQQEIQERLSTRFPLQRSLVLINLTLRDPKVVLREGSDRVTTELTADVAGPLGTLTGNVVVSGVPFYDATRKAFFLNDPALDSLRVPGLTADLETQTRQLVEAVAKPTLRELPVYELTGKDAKEVTAQYALREVRVKDGKLQAVLGLPK